jgi:hypothetical protein
MRASRLDRSSAVERAQYDDEERTLSIWFRGGRRYIYSGVEREVYDRLCTAPSAGAFVDRTIRGRYPCRADPARRRYPLS